MLMLFEKPCGGKIYFIIERFYGRKLTYRSKLIWTKRREKKTFFIMINIGPFVILIMGKIAQ